MSGYLGNSPTSVPLSSADILDGAITSAKIADGTIVNADINASAAIVSTKLSGVQGKFESALLHIRDEKASGTHGGTSQTSYTTRDLNTSLTNEISGASLASSQITLPSGTYYIRAFAPAYASDRHTIKLRNITDSTDTLLGTSVYAEGSNTNYNMSMVTGRFTISSQKTFAIQHRCQTSTASTGFGISKDMSETNVYTDVQIWKVA
jgi:hypothetical protein